MLLFVGFEFLPSFIHLVLKVFFLGIYLVLKVLSWEMPSSVYLLGFEFLT